MNKINTTAQRICIIGLSLITMLILTAALGGFYSSENDAAALLPKASAAATDSRKDSQVLNILLIGQDSRSGETARSDSMILCSIRKDEKKLTLTSFLRDLYVKIPGHGSNRLNAAYAFGGAKLLKKTLEHNFGIQIDGCVEVDFSCFPEIIDVLGGVTIDLRPDEARLINRSVSGSSLTEGSQKLTGQQALVYARIRSLDADGDFSRTRRQRKVLIALMNAYKDAGLVKGVAMVKKLIPYVSTDMTKETILSHAKVLVPMMSGMKLASQIIPASGTYSCRRIQGMEVLVADMAAAGKQLAETIGGNAK